MVDYLKRDIVQSLSWEYWKVSAVRLFSLWVSIVGLIHMPCQMG
jgi:hypothetical protein